MGKYVVRFEYDDTTAMTIEATSALKAAQLFAKNMDENYMSNFSNKICDGRKQIRVDVQDLDKGEWKEFRVSGYTEPKYVAKEIKMEVVEFKPKFIDLSFRNPPKFP